MIIIIDVNLVLQYEYIGKSNMVNNQIFLYNILDNTSHFITQFSWAYGDRKRRRNGGGCWHTLFRSSLLHDSLLKQNRHSMQARHSLTNLPGWRATIPCVSN